MVSASDIASVWELNTAPSDLTSRNFIDVMDIQFQFRQIPADTWPFFTIWFLFQFQPKCWIEPNIVTGYFTHLTNIDIRKFTYLLATKPCYSLQCATATKQQQSNYWNLLVNYSSISNYIIVHNVYSKTCIPHRQIAVQWSNRRTIRFRRIAIIFTIRL